MYKHPETFFRLHIRVFCRDHAACSKASPMSLTYPGSCKSCFSRKPVFGGKISLIFPIIYQIAHLHNWPSFPLIFADRCLMPDLSSFNWFGCKNDQFSQFAHRFHRDQMCFGIFDVSDIEITQNLYLSDLIMPKPVFSMTVHEAHKVDQIWAKYKLLDSGECGSVGTPAFNAECSELTHLMAQMSELCKHLSLPMPKELHRPLHFKH